MLMIDGRPIIAVYPLLPNHDQQSTINNLCSIWSLPLEYRNIGFWRRFSLPWCFTDAQEKHILRILVHNVLYKCKPLCKSVHYKYLYIATCIYIWPIRPFWLLTITILWPTIDGVGRISMMLGLNYNILSNLISDIRILLWRICQCICLL